MCSQGPVTFAEAVDLLARLTKELDARAVLDRDLELADALPKIRDVAESEEGIADLFSRLQSAPPDLIWSCLDFPDLDLSDPYLTDKAGQRLSADATDLERVETVRQVACEVFSMSLPSLDDEVKMGLVATAVLQASGGL